MSTSLCTAAVLVFGDVDKSKTSVAPGLTEHRTRGEGRIPQR